MSTLRVQNIGAPGAGTTTEIMEGVAKVVSDINTIPATPTLNKTFNVSTVVDHGVGEYSINIPSPFKDLLYIPTAGGYGTTIVVKPSASVRASASQIRFITSASGSYVVTDGQYNGSMIFGDLA